MKILIACEESQTVCSAFRKLGHEAYSCDLLECSGGHPEWHIMGDCIPIINGNIKFFSMDGKIHNIEGRWDIIIAHPPCTRLCLSGQRWLYYGSREYRLRKRKDQEKAIDFFMKFVTCDCLKVAIENPVGIMNTLYRKPDCIYNPYEFLGETECKKTCLWLKNLSPLLPSRITPLPVSERTHGIWKGEFDGKKYSWNDPQVARLRSKTPLGVADAMAHQWGNKF